jgi:uncharacterized membrane protein YdjX (TVP38/TMEM64 family)
VPRVVTGVTLVAVGLVFVVPAWREVVLAAGGYLVRMDFVGLRDYLQGYEDRAWLMSSLLMIAQSLAAPIPAVPITLANALIYGVWMGALISWGIAQVASVLCFYIGQVLGRPFVERLFSRRQVARWDRFFERYGALTIFVARLIPVVGFDVVSYAAGFTRVRMLTFFVATGLGQLPATIAYSYAGANLAESPATAVGIVLWFVGGVTLVAGIWWLRARGNQGGMTGDPV